MITRAEVEQLGALHAVAPTMVVATCTKECARCHNHAYATRLSASAKGPVGRE